MSSTYDKEYYVAHRKERAAAMKRYQQSEKGKDFRKRQYSTVIGRLRTVYNDIVRRCSGVVTNPNNKNYVTKGIRNLFLSFEDFAEYVVKTLQADPRGKQIHRIDNDGHYEKGNIEFLVHEEHVEAHRKIRAKILRGMVGRVEEGVLLQKYLVRSV